MASAYHVHGPCYIQTYTGSSNAYETVGMTRDGARISIEPIRLPIKSDAAGDGEADFQVMGDRARISLELVAWDKAILTKLVQKASGTATEGQSGEMGTILGVGGFMHKLYLPSSTDDPWVFNYVTMNNPHELNVGSEHGKKRLVFTAIRLVGPTATGMGTVSLYSRTAPA
jgi:hypothetical protein